MSDNNSYFLLLKVFGAELDSDRSSSDLPVGELESWIMMRINVNRAFDSECLKVVIQFVDLIGKSFVIPVFVENRDQDCLNLRNARR